VKGRGSHEVHLHFWWWATDWNTDKELRGIQQAGSDRCRLSGSKVDGSCTGLCLAVEFIIGSVKDSGAITRNLVGWLVGYLVVWCCELTRTMAKSFWILL
jgi:hypothetical protein